MDENKDIDKKVTNDDEIENTSLSETTGSIIEANDESIESKIQPLKQQNKFKRLFNTKKKKIILGCGAVVIILAVIFAVPITRYAVLGTFITKSAHVVVVDSVTMKPVSQATVLLGDKTAKTDGKGEATLSGVPVGEYKVKVIKNYYKNNEESYTVPVLRNTDVKKLQLVATGRQVSIVVANKITHGVLAKAVVTVRDTSATTDDKGIATIVLPANQKTLPGTIKLEGYNDIKIDVKVTGQADVNKFSVTPAGTIYFLSKQTGKINVMGSDLDGVNSRVIVEGTGNENDRTTALLAARDWNYMALLANRETNKTGQLYLINAKTGKLQTIDEGDASFQLVGWSGHHFIYLVYRDNANSWEPKTQRLKSYNADTGELKVIDENQAMGSSYYDHQSENINSPHIIDGKIVYAKTWTQGPALGYAPSDKKSAIMTMSPDGTGKKRIKEFAMQQNIGIEAKLYEPQELYFRVSSDGEDASYYEYEEGVVKSVTNTDDKFYNTYYATYLLSPNSEKTFWYEPRDGKNALFIGDKQGKNVSEFAKQSELLTYGWYSDKYVLLSKNSSELFIAPADKPLLADGATLKITNYHKPSLTYPGYGSGYGGL